MPQNTHPLSHLLCSGQHIPLFHTKASKMFCSDADSTEATIFQPLPHDNRLLPSRHQTFPPALNSNALLHDSFTLCMWWGEGGLSLIRSCLSKIFDSLKESILLTLI